MPPTITTACHVAHLDPMTGEGLLTMPVAASDLTLCPLTASLHASDELAMLAQLHAHGFQLAEDEDGQPWCRVGFTEDGREVFALYGREPITTMPTLLEQAEAMTALRGAAGVAA